MVDEPIGKKKGAGDKAFDDVGKALSDAAGNAKNLAGATSRKVGKELSNIGKPTTDVNIDAKPGKVSIDAAGKITNLNVNREQPIPVAAPPKPPSAPRKKSSPHKPKAERQSRARSTYSDFTPVTEDEVAGKWGISDLSAASDVEKQNIAVATRLANIGLKSGGLNNDFYEETWREAQIKGITAQDPNKAFTSLLRAQIQKTPANVMRGGFGQRTAEVETISQRGQAAIERLKGKTTLEQERMKQTGTRESSELTAAQALATKMMTDADAQRARNTAQETAFGGGVRSLASTGITTTGGIIETAIEAGASRPSRSSRDGPGIPLTTPEVNPYWIPTIDQSFIAYGGNKIESGPENTVLELGGRREYEAPEGSFLQFGGTKMAGAMSTNTLEGIGGAQIAGDISMSQNSAITQIGNDAMKDAYFGNSKNSPLVDIGETIMRGQAGQAPTLGINGVEPTHLPTLGGSGIFGGTGEKPMVVEIGNAKLGEALLHGDGGFSLQSIGEGIMQTPEGKTGIVHLGEQVAGPNVSDETTIFSMGEKIMSDPESHSFAGSLCNTCKKKQAEAGTEDNINV